MRLSANAGPKKVAKNRHLGIIPQLCRAISSQLRHVSTIGKNLLSSNISSTCPHNMVNFGLLATEIVLLVWGTTGNFNGFRVLVALLHGTLVVGVSRTAAFNRGRHLYSAGRPARWALAHILVILKQNSYWLSIEILFVDYLGHFPLGRRARVEIRNSARDAFSHKAVRYYIVLVENANLDGLRD